MSELRRKFEEYHAKNPQVYELFKRFANEAISHGRKTLSASLICERIRWETSVVTKSDDGFKITNNHMAYYARLWMEDHPLSGATFRTREVEHA
jgi:hypothetical protein